MVPLPGAAGRTAAAYHAAMASTTNLQRTVGLWRVVRSWLGGWWQIIHLGAVLGVLALSASGRRQAWGSGLAGQVYRASGPMLAGFTIATAVLSLVVIRIVIVTAQSYGLSQYALEMVVRVLVLELIPLAAALYVAVEYSIAGGSQLYKLRRDGGLQRLRAAGHDPLTHEVLPRVLGAVFAVLLLAALSCAISLVLTYVAVHGFTTAGVASFNRAVGHIFNPAVTLIFVLKTFLFAVAVALLPMANALRDIAHRPSRTSVELQGLVQMLVLMLVIEIASLVGNYY